MIKRPMKAPGDSITDEQLPKLFRLEKYWLGSPKLDGIRAVTDGKCVWSNSLKPIGNQYIQQCLSTPEYEGFDGELVVGSPFNTHEEDNVFWRTSGDVRKKDGRPDFRFYVFDDWRYPREPYEKRWLQQIKDYPEIKDIPHIIILEQRPLYCPQDIIDFTNEMVELGYEGAMIRRPSAPYKEGRATFLEELIYKRKPFDDDEAEIVGYFEQLENTNEKVTNALGTSSRSSHKANLIPKGTLGGFVLKSKLWADTFNCGTIIGSTLAMRQDLWDNREAQLGKIVTYKYQKYGSVDKPRIPRIKGFRDKADMTDY